RGGGVHHQRPQKTRPPPARPLRVPALRGRGPGAPPRHAGPLRARLAPGGLPRRPARRGRTGRHRRARQRLFPPAAPAPGPARAGGAGRAGPDPAPEERSLTMTELFPETPQEIQALLEAHPWTFARTMPRNPHEYTLRKTWEHDQEFVQVVLFIRTH